MRFKAHHLIFIKIISICLFLINERNVQAGSWQSETVDEQATHYSLEEQTELILDSHDNPHMCYRIRSDETDSLADHLMYTFHDGVEWHKEVIDTKFSGIISLALDSNDNPHIAYQDQLSYSLKYAKNDDGSWCTETVDSNLVFETWRWGSLDYIFLRLDNNDNPHICYLDYANRSVKYAFYNGNEWNITVLFTGKFIPPSHPLALDSNDHPHIFCQDWDDNLESPSVVHIYFDGNSWHQEIVEEMSNAGTLSMDDLVLDSNDNPHLIYDDLTNDVLRYAHYDGRDWKIETIESGDDVGWHISIALDSNEQPRASYLDWENGIQKYAYYDGTWNIEKLDWSRSQNDLALDSHDNPHIIYVKDEGSFFNPYYVLKYVSLDPTPPVTSSTTTSVKRFFSLNNTQWMYTNASDNYLGFDSGEIYYCFYEKCRKLQNPRLTHGFISFFNATECKDRGCTNLVGYALPAIGWGMATSEFLALSFCNFCSIKKISDNWTPPWMPPFER